jgi:hypothetical protein
LETPETNSLAVLTVLDHLPQGLLDLEAQELWQILPQPALIHLTGLNKSVLFISVLLHGNETTGWLAVRQLLRHYGNAPLPRSISLFIGNVVSARHRLRRLDSQTDLNRIWDKNCQAVEAAIARGVMAEMTKRALFACIDIHNNTGRNPYYSCLSCLDPPFLDLARPFSSIVLYYPPRVSAPLLINAFSKFCPAVLLESGQPDRPEGTAHVLQYLEQILADNFASTCWDRNNLLHQ